MINILPQIIGNLEYRKKQIKFKVTKNPFRNT